MRDESSRIPPRFKWKRRNRFELLAAWYGSERAEVEISAHTCQPESIGTVLDEFLTETGKKGGGVLVRLRSEWSKIAGSSFARFTIPAAFRDGILILEVRHSALIAELSLSSDLLLTAVNRAAGERVCREIKFRVG